LLILASGCPPIVHCRSALYGNCAVLPATTRVRTIQTDASTCR